MLYCSVLLHYTTQKHFTTTHYTNLLDTLCCFSSQPLYNALLFHEKSPLCGGKILSHITVAPHFCCSTESTFHTQPKFAWYVTLWCLAEISVKDYWSITELLLKYDNKKRPGNWIKKNILYLCRDIKVDKEHIRPKLFHNPYCHMGGEGKGQGKRTWDRTGERGNG